MALFNRTQVGLKETGSPAQVPAAPAAKLMYYLDCICSVLQLNDDADLNRFRRFNEYRSLTLQDKKLLINLGTLFNPILLLNKCIFKDDQLCGDSSNKFFALETVRNSLLVAGDVLIGGVNRRVTKIMTFKGSWVEDNWTSPIQALLAEQEQAEERIQQQRREQQLREQQRREQERREQQQREEMRREQHRLDQQRMGLQIREQAMRDREARWLQRHSRTCLIL